MKNLWKSVLLGAVIIILDQVTKALVQSRFNLGESLPIIKGFFNFTYVRNPGAAFGFLATASESIRKPLFLLIPVLACFWLIYLIWSVRNKNALLCVAYSMILSGAIGNLIDRFSMGYVVDFLDFHWGQAHFPAFNIADSSISIAAGLLVIDFYLEYKNKKNSDSNENAANHS